MKNKGKKTGVTLIESMVALVFSAIFITSFLQMVLKETEDNREDSFSKDLIDVVSAVDKRLSIDGFQSDYWNKQNWANNDEIVNDLIAKQLIAKDATCGTGVWIPKSPNENKTKLVNCDLWKRKIPYKADMEASIEKDSLGYITEFNLLLKFKNDEDFKKYYNSIRDSFKKAKANDKKEKSGRHDYITVKKDNPTEEISLMECIKEKTNCAFKVSFNRSGSADYIRVDGSNSMIASHLSFIKTNVDSPMQCDIWQKQSDNTWKMRREDCGIGIYDKTNYPIIANTATENVTAKNILLNQSCGVYSWNNTTKKVEKNTTINSPCGMSEDGNTIIQVVDKVNAENGLFKNANIEIADIGNLTTGTITTDFIKAKNGLITLENNSKVKGTLSVDGNSTFNYAKFLSNVQIDGNINSNNQISGNKLYSRQDVQADRNINANNQVSGNHLYSRGNIDSENQVYAKNKFYTRHDVQADRNINANNQVSGNRLYSRGNIDSENQVYAKNRLYTRHDVQADRNINANNQVSGNHLYSRGSINAEGQVQGSQLYSRGRVISQEYMEVRGWATEGHGCSPNGLLARGGNSLLICNAGRWQGLGKVDWNNMPAGARCGDFVMSGGTTRAYTPCMGHNPRYSCPPGFSRRDFGYFEAGGGPRQYNWCVKN